MTSLSITSATGKLNGPRPPIREMLRARTRELALRAGRTAAQVSQVDYEQAKRDLTGESEMDRQDAVLDSPQPAAAMGDRPELKPKSA